MYGASLNDQLILLMKCTCTYEISQDVVQDAFEVDVFMQSMSTAYVD